MKTVIAGCFGLVSAILMASAVNLARGVPPALISPFIPAKRYVQEVQPRSHNSRPVYRGHDGDHVLKRNTDLQQSQSLQEMKRLHPSRLI